MKALLSVRFARALRFVIPAILLTGCFGEGDGPDPILGTPAPPPPPLPPGFCDPVNFEDVCPGPGIANFAGGATTIVDHDTIFVGGVPVKGGINSSDQVAQMQKFADQPFGGTTIVPTTPVTFASREAFTMKVWSPREVPVLFKLEGLDQERSVSHTGSGSWEELCFDFTGATAGDPVTGITIIFDLGVNGAAATDPGNWTFWYDDIEQVDECPGAGPTTWSTITFDDPGINYSLAGFGGAEDSQIVNDPAGGVNQVVQVNRAANAEVFAGTTVGTGLSNTVPTIPLDAASPRMTVRVYSPAAGIPVRLKIENANDGAIAVETEATTTVANAWEELTFDFANQVAGTPAFSAGATYNKVIIFFNFGAAGAAAQTYFFDDIDVAGGGGGPGPVPFSAVTFDDPSVTYSLRGFGGAEDSTVVVDPTGGTNQVVQVNRSATAEFFAGTVAFTGPNESVGVIPLDAANTTMNLRVYSPAAGIPVRLKIENSANGAIAVETEATTTVANAWETLTFDFINEVPGTAQFDASATYDKVVVFFNFGTTGADAGAQTFYFDDVDVGPGAGGPPTPTFVPITFDDLATTYELRGFGGAEDSSVVVDPTDSGNNVVQVNRSATAEFFAGTVVFTGPNESIPAIPLDAANTLMNVRVWSPAAGIPVRLKIENSLDPGVSVETEATTTAAMTWETLTFDFATEVSGTPAFNPAAIYDKVVIFFNFGTTGADAGAQTFYFDDIDVGSGAPTVPASADFESGSATFNDFEGGVAAVVANPDPSGLNTSSLVGQMQKGTGAPFAGSTLDLGGIAPLAVGDSYTMLVRAVRPVPVTFKIEGAGLGDERVANYGGSQDWELLCFDFSGVGGNVTGYTLIFDNGVVGDAGNADPNIANNWIFQFDDIQQVSSCPPVDTFSTLTFDDPAVTYSLRGFEGAEASALATDPEDANNTVVQVDRTDTAQFFAGTVAWTGPNESVDKIPLDNSNTTMSIRVRAPAAGIPVRLKIENSANGAVSVETEATTTAADTWETLTFDFANQVSGTAAFNEVATYDKIVVFFNFGTDGATAGAQTFYFDDVAVGSGGGGGAATLVNGDFEANGGSLDGWVPVFGPPGIGTVATDNSGQGGRAGTVARLNAAGQGTSGNDVLIVQGPIGAGTIQAGDTITVSFDLYGTLAGPGGVVFVEVIFLDAGGGDNGRDFLNSDPTPYFPNNMWTTYSGSVTAGTTAGGGTADGSGGITLSLKAACGADLTCATDASFDNVTLTIN